MTSVNLNLKWPFLFEIFLIGTLNHEVEDFHLKLNYFTLIGNLSLKDIRSLLWLPEED